MKKQLLILAIMIIFLASAVSAAEQTFYGKTAFGQALFKNNALELDNKFAWMNPWLLNSMGVKDYLSDKENNCVKLGSTKIGVSFKATDSFCGTQMTIHYKIGGKNGKESLTVPITPSPNLQTVFLEIKNFKLENGEKWGPEDLDKLKALVDLSINHCKGAKFCPRIDWGWVKIDSIFLVADCKCTNAWLKGPDGPAFETDLIACQEQIGED